MRPDKDTYYLDIALAVLKRSTCLRRRYGCVIVKNDTIIATGYNGNPRGEGNCCDIPKCERANAERYSGYEKCNAVHAEQNALISASREQLIGATVYLACETFSNFLVWEEDINPVPCNMCMNMLKNAGIVNVITRSNELCL